MDIVTKALVEYVLINYVDENLIITNEAVGYLRELLRPYIEAAMLADGPKSLFTWMNQLFNEEILSHINAEINYMPNMQGIIRAMIVALLIAILDDMQENTYMWLNIITPWDIKRLLKLESKRDIARYFGIPVEQREDININNSLLPVVVTINGQSFTHEMTYEHVLGILAFYRLLRQQHPLSMYGLRFEDFDDILRGRITQETEMYRQSGYTINVGPEIYVFHDTEFMRGLLTAAMWMDIDPHVYITNLMDWRVDTLEALKGIVRQGKPLNF